MLLIRLTYLNFTNLRNERHFSTFAQVYRFSSFLLALSFTLMFAFLRDVNHDGYFRLARAVSSVP